MRTPEEEERYREAEAKCCLFMERGIACRDCDCGNDQHYRKDTTPAPWSREKIAQYVRAEAQVIKAALAWFEVSGLAYHMQEKEEAEEVLVAAVRAYKEFHP